MQACTRGEPPALLATYGNAIGADYASKRALDPAYRFQWPRRDGQSLYAVARAAVGEMTEEHCAYCDGFPLDATGSEAVDHFKPKGRQEFYALVCEWTNLFLTCGACNHAKREQWEEDLLRPDETAYDFEIYFEYRFDTGELHPAPTAPVDAQRRATRTIKILNLNRAGACTSRKSAVRRIRHGEFQDTDYRFLVPLCSAMEPKRDPGA